MKTDYSDIKDATGALEVFERLRTKHAREIGYDLFTLLVTKANKDRDNPELCLGLLTLAAKAMIPAGMGISIDDQPGYDVTVTVGLPISHAIDCFTAEHPLECMACLMAVKKIKEGD